MKQYTVTGMSCAACSSRVEKAVSKVPGVTACSVSLLTNSMGVEGDVPPETVIHAVEDAGYGASLKGQGAAAQAQHIAFAVALGEAAEVTGKFLVGNFADFFIMVVSSLPGKVR